MTEELELDDVDELEQRVGPGLPPLDYLEARDELRRRGLEALGPVPAALPRIMER